jgi:hypothetical protein
MAQFTFSNNTYAGSELAGFMASTLLEADSVKRGLITVINNVKARKVILDVDDEAILQDPSGMFVDQGTTATQNESYLDPIVYEFMKQEQWDKLIQSWENSQIKPGSLQDYDGVVDLTDFMIKRYISKLQIANERLYWLGKTASPTVNKFTAAFPGLLSQINAASGTFKVSLASTAGAFITGGGTIAATGVVTVTDTTGLVNGDVVTITVTAGAITETTNSPAVALLNTPTSYFINSVTSTTFKLVRNYNDINRRVNSTFSGTATAATIVFINASNVIPVLGSVYAQLDPADRAQEDFKLLIPLHVSYAFKQAQANKALNVIDAFTKDKVLEYLGQVLEPMNHWNANQILGARTSNLFLGVDLLGDESELLTVDLRQATGDCVVRMKARMKAATNFKFANELFLYTY